MRKPFVCAMLAAAALAINITPVQAQFVVKVGYADSLRKNGFFPDPWEGSPNTTFWGRLASSGEYDAGAVMIMNTGSTTLVLTSARVDGFSNGASFQIWDGTIGSGYTIPAGQNLILTQNNGTENFDTSDQGPGNPSGVDAQGRAHGDNTTPHVKFTLNRTFYDLVDSGQVLNTSGFDFANNPPGGQNESFAWRKIGTFGGQAGDTPEPGTFALLGAGMLSGAGMAMKLRRKTR